VYPPFTSLALGAKAANQPTNRAIPFQNPASRIMYTLGVINPSYEMRLYLVRIRDTTRAGNYFWQRGRFFICASNNELFAADAECF